MDTGAHLSAFAADSQAVADLAAGHLDRPVAACPGWTVADLLGHLGGVYSWVGLVLEAAGERPTLQRDSAPADPAELVEWFEARRAATLDGLSSREPDDPAWTFVAGARATVGWWRRRQAMETAIHLFDMEQAVDRPGSMDPELAADGVDEVLTELLPGFLGRRPVPALRGTFHVHATDTPGEWSLDFGAEGLGVRREHSKADTALRGPAAGLFLWVWNRRSAPTAGLEAFGDGSVIDGWSEVKL